MTAEMTMKEILPGADRQDANLVRTIVFIDEQGFSPENELDDIDPTACHVVLYHDGQPIGTARTFPDPEDPACYIIGRVAVLKEHRGGGTGRILMEAVEALAIRQGARRLYLGAQCHASGFYQKLGYETYGEHYYDEHCEHVHMQKFC